MKRLKSNIISRVKIFAAIQIATMTIFSSCISTDLVDDNNESDCIRISVSAPQDAKVRSSRASADLQLRYVAKLYFAKKESLDQKVVVARKEWFASDGKTVSFEATQGNGTYTVTIFADYVKDGISADAKGHYPDFLYKTDNSGDDHATITMINKGATSDCNINNDDYICFSAIKEIEKDAYEQEVDITLKHAVCKIRIVDDSAEDLTNIDKINISNLSYTKYYIFGNSGQPEINNVTSPIVTEPSDIDNKELFYFYSFPTQEGRTSFEDISFSITGKGDYIYNAGETITIGNDKFKGLKANTIYTLKSGFAEVTGSPSSTININITEDSNWGGTSDIK